MRWVRPIFVIAFERQCPLVEGVCAAPCTAGTSLRRSSSTAAMCIAVGNVSFEDCEQLTSSFGWTGSFEPRTPPASSIARFAITSFTFMLVWVPLPVCHTRSGNSSSSRPSATSRAARSISVGSVVVEQRRARR